MSSHLQLFFSSLQAEIWFIETVLTVFVLCLLSTRVPSFNLLGLKVPEKKLMKNFNVRKFERKKNEEIKG